MRTRRRIPICEAEGSCGKGRLVSYHCWFGGFSLLAGIYPTGSGVIERRIGAMFFDAMVWVDTYGFLFHAGC
jgi:hypothetical protein